MNPCEKWVKEVARLSRAGKKLPLGGIRPRRLPPLPPNAAKVLILSPHPDDECIIGGLPLRLRREARMEVTNVAVTLGSKKSRREERWKELEAACAHLGFRLRATASSGLEQITLESRKQNRVLWNRAVKIISTIIAETKPRVILLPHNDDGHAAHIGTHFLVLDALKKMPRSFACWVVETEFWRAMAAPNLMVESSVRDVGELVTALSCHAGEVRRNPYHLLLPAWMQDNVRRGAELVGGSGAKAPDFLFATLYRLRFWGAGQLKVTEVGGHTLSSAANPGKLFRK